MHESAVYFRMVEICEFLESGTCEVLESGICEVRESGEILIRELQRAVIFINKRFGDQEGAKLKMSPQKFGYKV
jgi:hypothetical protein